MDAIKTILLTGATGYLGSKLAEAFIMDGYNLIVLKRQSSNTKRIDSLTGNFKSYDVDLDSGKEAFKRNKIECVVHAAASYGRKGESLSEVYRANLGFPVGLLDNCLEYNVKYFFNTGTSLPQNLNNYSLSKAQFVDVLKQQHFIKAINIELQYFYGANDDNSKFITFILEKIFLGSPNIDLSEGTQLRDFIYIDDVISAYLLLLKSIQNQKEQFLSIPLGSGRVYTLRRIVEKIKKYSQSDIELTFGALPMRNSEVMYSKANISTLRKLGWQPKYDIDRGLRETIKKEKLLLV